MNTQTNTICWAIIPEGEYKEMGYPERYFVFPNTAFGTLLPDELNFNKSLNDDTIIDDTNDIIYFAKPNSYKYLNQYVHILQVFAVNNIPENVAQKIVSNISPAKIVTQIFTEKYITSIHPDNE